MQNNEENGMFSTSANSDLNPSADFDGSSSTSTSPDHDSQHTQAVYGDENKEIPMSDDYSAVSDSIPSNSASDNDGQGNHIVEDTMTGSNSGSDSISPQASVDLDLVSETQGAYNNSGGSELEPLEGNIDPKEASSEPTPPGSTIPKKRPGRKPNEEQIIAQFQEQIKTKDLVEVAFIMGLTKPKYLEYYNNVLDKGFKPPNLDYKVD
jgi:hypothetical protein